VGAIPAIDIIKGEDGIWEVTTPPIVPGFHYYYFTIDGVTVDDPASRTFYGVWKDSTGIDVPEKGADYYLIQDVPHGEVRERWYHSTVTSKWRRCFVYTPPDYDLKPVIPLHSTRRFIWSGWGWARQNLSACTQALPTSAISFNRQESSMCSMNPRAPRTSGRPGAEI
jgi:hypothetical protein